MKPVLYLLVCVFPLSSGCRTTVDTSETVREVASTRHGAELILRQHDLVRTADEGPRVVARIGQRLFREDEAKHEWRSFGWPTRGTLPTLAFDEERLFAMTSDVTVSGPSDAPEILQTSRLWGYVSDESEELLFETNEVILGSFVARSEGYALAIYRAPGESPGRQLGTALLRFEDGGLGRTPLAGFESATLLLVDPVDDIEIVVGQRPAGAGMEWGLFRLEGVERRALLFEPRVVAPAFSPDGLAFAYAWRPDGSLARSGEDETDGPFGRLSMIERSTGAGQHLDTELDVLATGFDPTLQGRLYVIGLTLTGADSEYALLTIDRKPNGLAVTRRQTFSLH